MARKQHTPSREERHQLAGGQLRQYRVAAPVLTRRIRAAPDRRPARELLRPSVDLVPVGTDDPLTGRGKRRENSNRAGLGQYISFRNIKRRIRNRLWWSPERLHRVLARKPGVSLRGCGGSGA